MTAQLVTLVITAAEPNLRGLLTRWLVEPIPGLYCGLLTTRVRDQLWQHIAEIVESTDAHAALIWRDQNKVAIRTAGDRARVPVDIDGTTLIAWAINDPFDQETSVTPTSQGPITNW